MAAIMTKQGNLDNIVTYEHICDTFDDIQTIDPHYITLGSTCVVINGESGGLEVYMANSEKEWVSLSVASGSGEGSSSLGIQILGSNDYDSETGVPTIEEPVENIFYLVPNNNDTNDLYEEWIYTNGNWEKFGSGGAVTTIVNADWNAAYNEDGYINNKPTIVSGSGYNSIEENRNTHDNKNINSYDGRYSYLKSYTTGANGSQSHTEGYNTTTLASYAHAEGYMTIAKGAHSHSEGNNTFSNGQSSHAEGEGTMALGQNAHAEGMNTIAQNSQSHAEGRQTQARGSESHAEGYETIAAGDYAHAEGQQTQATAMATHAEGYQTLASGANSHTEGNNTKAYGPNTHAEGLNTVASHRSQHVFGEYNSGDTSTDNIINRGEYVEIVGNGTNASNLSNARTLDWSGNQWLAGSLTLNQTTLTENNLIELLNLRTTEITISDTDVIIAANSNTRYICGEVSTLDFTPSTTGICDVKFTSGSQKTILTLPSTVKMPDWFEVEANMTYEISIADGVYGVVTSWAV